MKTADLEKLIEKTDADDVAGLVQGFCPGETMEGVAGGFVIETVGRGMACGPVSFTALYHVSDRDQAEAFSAALLVFDRQFGGNADDSVVESASAGFREAFGDSAAMTEVLTGLPIHHTVTVYDVIAVREDRAVLESLFGLQVEEVEEDGKDIFDLGNYRAMEI